MQRMVSTILRQYGTVIRISGAEGERTVKGLFQPVRAKSVQSMVSLETPLGEATRRQYVFIGPGDLEMTEGNVLSVGDREYFLQRMEKYHYCDQVIYTWGMCVEKGGADTWGTQS